jgi:membrane protein
VTPAGTTDQPASRYKHMSAIRRLGSTSWSGVRGLGLTFWTAVLGYQRHNVNRLSASIAFYGVLSLAPLAVIGVSVAGFFFGHSAAEGLIVDQLKNSLGAEAARAVQGVLANAYQSPATVPATILAGLVLIWSSTRLVGDIRKSLNTIWEVQGRGGDGFKGFLIGKLIDAGMVLVLAVLFLLTVAASIALSAVTHYFAQNLPFPTLAFYLSGLFFSLVVAAVFLAVIFRWLPNLNLAWRDVALGSALSAMLFEVGNYVLGYYLARSSPGSAFGAAGSFVVIMVWMYYSAIIVLFGVEVARAYRERSLAGAATAALRVSAMQGPPQAGRGGRPGAATSAAAQPHAVAAERVERDTKTGTVAPAAAGARMRHDPDGRWHSAARRATAIMARLARAVGLFVRRMPKPGKTSGRGGPR